MNNEDIKTLGGLLMRAAIVGVGGALSSGGVQLTETQVDSLSGAGLLILGIVLSVLQKRKAAKKLKAVEQQGEFSF